MKRSIASFVALGMLLTTTAAFAEDNYFCKGDGATVRIDRDRETFRVKATYPDSKSNSEKTTVEYTTTGKQQGSLFELVSEDGAVSIWVAPPVLDEVEIGSLILKDSGKIFGLVCSDVTPEYPVRD